MFGWTGFLAGLFGFVLMGALAGPGGVVAGVTGESKASQHAQDHPAQDHHANYGLGKADHAHHHDHAADQSAHDEPASPDGSGPCKDHCCGAACHVLSGRNGTLAALFVAPAEASIVAPEFVRENDHLKRIDRPPRA